MVHIIWSISYGPYDMAGVIWSIWYGPNDMVQVIWPIIDPNEFDYSDLITA